MNCRGRDISVLEGPCIKCPSKISFQLDANTQISTNSSPLCNFKTLSAIIKDAELFLKFVR